MAETFNIFLIVMAVLAAGVYVALHFFEAGYGYLFNPKYGPPVPNKVGWVVMESPVFIAMCVLWLMSGRTWEAGPMALFVLFQAHYLQRAFIFPLLLRGESKMPLGIVVMGMAFNTLNALMQGGWIFYVSPEGYYADWFAQPYIYIGGAMFLYDIQSFESLGIAFFIDKSGLTGFPAFVGVCAFEGLFYHAGIMVVKKRLIATYVRKYGFECEFCRLDGCI